MNRNGQTTWLRTIIYRPSFSAICQQQSVVTSSSNNTHNPKNGNPHLPSTLGHALPCSSSGMPSCSSSPPSSVYRCHLQITAASYLESQGIYTSPVACRGQTESPRHGHRMRNGISMSEVELDYSSYFPLECSIDLWHIQTLLPNCPWRFRYLRSGSSAV
jgi:hypothetical protein